ncbi:MAG: RsmB/NOP family class I SAM-dependent RNA methyltransferase [Pseudomonadota bacterium]
MTPAARLSAAIEILDLYLEGTALEKALTNWARRSRFAGSKDRAAIRDIVFDCVRRRNSLAERGGRLSGRGLVLGWTADTHGSDATGAFFDGVGHAPEPLSQDECALLSEDYAPRSDASRFDMPEWLIARVRASYGAQAAEVADALRKRAPVFLRVNLKKTDRAGAADMLREDGIETRSHAEVETALEAVTKPRRIAGARAFLNGYVELQDASSQAACVALPSADRVLDYCAGGGGKILAYAALHEGTFFAHDAHAQRLKDLPARASRAGVAVTVLNPKSLVEQRLFDLVIADVPCSGSGTWRRAPEGKWALTPQKLQDLTSLQSEIFDQAAACVAPGGCLAYMTCSGLQCENEDQVVAFQKRNARFVVTAQKRFSPGQRGDGFFFAHLTLGQPAI